MGGPMHTTRPNRFRAMWGRHSRVMTNAPRALMDWMRSYLRVGVSGMVCHHSAEALLTRMSTRPKRATTSRTHVTHADSSRRSSAYGNASAPVWSARISSATVWMVPGRVGCGEADFAATTTCAPARASAKHTSRPIPRLPPVTIATRPRRSGGGGKGMVKVSRFGLTSVHK